MINNVWVVSIDVGRGVLEPVHAFASADSAEQYRQWKENSGDLCYVAEVPVEPAWEMAA